MRRKYFVLISLSLVVVFVIISIQFKFDFPFAAVLRPSEPQPNSPVVIFWLQMMMFLLSLLFMVGGAWFSYVSWFRSTDEMRERLGKTLEEYHELRYGASASIDPTYFLWLVRITAPFLILVGLFLFKAILDAPLGEGFLTQLGAAK